MSDKEAPKTKLLWLVVGGVVSLVFGVSGALITSYLSTASPELTYAVSAVDFFEGQQNNLGVVTINVSNPGRQEVESVECNVRLDNVKIKEPRFSGLTPSGLTLKPSTDSVTASVPYLNPRESFTLQILVEPTGGTKLNPEVEVRGKGILGIEAEDSDVAGRNGLEITPVIVALLSAFIANVAAAKLLVRRSRLVRKLAGNILDEKDDVLGYDKQDMFAFVVGLNGFHEFAERVRNQQRRLSWLSYSDALTEHVLKCERQDLTTAANAIKALETVLATVERLRPATVAVINTNIARLHIRMGDESAARKFLNAAAEEHKQVCEARSKILPELSLLGPSCTPSIANESSKSGSRAGYPAQPPHHLACGSALGGSAERS